jgi:hypothetical protein
MGYSPADILAARRKWIDFLKLPTTKKAQGELVDSADLDARCCLGHACHVLGATADHDRYLNEDGERHYHYPPREIVDQLGLWNNAGGGETFDGGQHKPSLSNGQVSLAYWNDRADEPVTQAEIGEWLETVIMGGPETPFKEITIDG